jgi:hypothetical protein
MYSLQILEGKPEGKRPSVRPRHRWATSIKTSLKIGHDGVDWINLGQDRLQCGLF